MDVINEIRDFQTTIYKASSVERLLFRRSYACLEFYTAPRVQSIFRITRSGNALGENDLLSGMGASERGECGSRRSEIQHGGSR